MSCPWVCEGNRGKRCEEKTAKYGPLRWELKRQNPSYDIEQCIVILDVLGGWAKELELPTKKLVARLVGAREKDVLGRMQKAIISWSLNIARTFKVTVV